MKLILLIFSIYLRNCTSSEDPKNDAELLPEAAQLERRRIKLFWSIMYEVCRSFCVWKQICEHFCDLFSIHNNDSEETGVLLEEQTLQHVKRRPWLYSTTLKICEYDEMCVENCTKMEFNHHESWQAEKITANVFRALFEITREYFATCAEMNSLPLTNVDFVTANDFCREITVSLDEYLELCNKSFN